MFCWAPGDFLLETRKSLGNNENRINEEKTYNSDDMPEFFLEKEKQT